MQNNYSYNCEEEALKAQMTYLFEKGGEALLEYYLNNGFDGLATHLKIANDFQRKMLFDFLIIEKKALLECVKRNKGFFLKMICDARGEQIRPMLGLKDPRYDAAWFETLDLLHIYYVEKKVDEKLSNLALDKFFENSILNTDNLKKKSLGDISEN